VPEIRLEGIHNYLNELLEGLTLEQVRQRVIRELGEEKNQYDAHIAAGLRMSKAALDDAPTEGQVIVSGGSNLLDATGADQGKLARTKVLLRALEEKELIVRLLDETMTSEQIQVFLGAETQYEPLGDASIVAMPYGPEEQPLGAIAVIGPTRMNYGKVMSVVDFTADLVSRMISSR
jgi:heat-inducible transcriptional repressor